MNNNETCIHGGVSPLSLLNELHHSQGGSGRHRCPTCAFEQGFAIGSSGFWKSYKDYCSNTPNLEECQDGTFAPTKVLLSLNDNQGGSGRHKCTNCAFKKGFETGVLGGTDDDFQSLILEEVEVPNVLNLWNSSNTSRNSIVDFFEQERKNRHLGLLGELFIVQKEKEWLISQNRKDLAKKVEHVSVEKGDGLGYDIISYDASGNVKKIEVKTTRGNIDRPFYISKNELDVSTKESSKFYLYRLFDFDSKLKCGKYYKINGNLNEALDLEARVYIAIPKSNK